MIFDPKVHICKFGFELYDYAMISPYKYKILGDMYNNELQILFFDKRYEKQVDAVGFKLSPQRVNELLPLIVWEDYEKMRDLPEERFWDFEMVIMDIVTDGAICFGAHPNAAHRYCKYG